LENLHKKDESIRVFCGDIFHHKLQISSHGIVLFYKLLYAIADMMPIVIIQGNHDLIQENNDENNDLIQALLDNNAHKNIHYCDKTSSFDIGNIHFGLVSIRVQGHVRQLEACARKVENFNRDKWRAEGARYRATAIR
jgi:DNA repair exonuclease SbcCD nuclease subunit